MKYIHILHEKQFNHVHLFDTLEVVDICYLYIHKKMEFARRMQSRMQTPQYFGHRNDTNIFLQTSIRYLYYLKKFIRQLCSRNQVTILNDTNLLGDEITHTDMLAYKEPVYPFSPKYAVEYATMHAVHVFDVLDIQQIVKAALFQQCNGIPDTCFPKNPYTNAPLSHGALFSCVRKIHPFALQPSFFEFYRCNFDIVLFIQKNVWSIRKKCAHDFMLSRDNGWIFAYLQDALLYDLGQLHCIKCIKSLTSARSWVKFIVSHFMSCNYGLYTNLQLVQIYQKMVRSFDLPHSDCCIHSKNLRRFKRFKKVRILPAIKHLHTIKKTWINSRYMGPVFIFGVDQYLSHVGIFKDVADFFSNNEKIALPVLNVKQRKSKRTKKIKTRKTSIENFVRTQHISER